MTARFLQEDTFAGQREDPLSLNLYTYCHNSPLLYSDPTGHAPGVMGPKPGTIIDYKKPKSISKKQEDSNKITYEKSNQPVVNNAGEAQYVNDLNAKKKNETDRKKEELQTLVNIMKNVSSLTEAEVIQILDGADKEGTLYNEWDTIEQTIKNQFPEINQKYKEVEVDDYINAIKQKIIDNKYLSVEFAVKPTAHDEILIIDLDEIKELYLNNVMTPKEEEKFWKAAFMLGTPYDHNQTIDPANPKKYPYPYAALDCSAFSSYVYIEEGFPHEAQQQAKLGTIIYKKGSTNDDLGTFQKEKLFVGDLIFYQLDSSKPITHVGIFMGFDKKGDPKIIDAGTGRDNDIRNCVSVRYLSCSSNSYDGHSLVRVASRFIDP